MIYIVNIKSFIHIICMIIIILELSYLHAVTWINSQDLYMWSMDNMGYMCNVRSNYYLYTYRCSLFVFTVF